MTLLTMPDDVLTSLDSLVLLSLWQRYDAAEEGDKADLRKLIELQVSSFTYQRVHADMQRFHQEFREGMLK